MKALLVGPLAQRFRRSRNQVVIAVDGGMNACKRSRICPDLAIGDWDSYRGSLGEIPSITLPQKKDRSDLYYALRAAAALDVIEIDCIGLTGGRADHHLAGLHEMAEAAKLFTRVTASDENAEYHFLSSSKNGAWKARLPLGTTVSVFPLGGSASGVTLDGFEYPLRNDSLRLGSHGLSNRTVKKQQRIRVKKGNLVVILCHVKRT